MTKLSHTTRIPHLSPRPAEGHKGTFGRVLVIGGSVGMAGAPTLVGNAALRSGAGLVTIAVPEPVLGVVAGLCPCATTIPLPADKSGQIKPAEAHKVLGSRKLIGPADKAAPPDCLVVGPGLGTGSARYAAGVWDLIDEFRSLGVPVVADADALNLAALLPDGGWRARKHARTVCTPHPGELGRMLQVSIGQVQADRQHVAADAARQLNANTDDSARAVLVLKGAGTVVTDGESVYVNKTGNPGMATGGSGDVLSGMIGALVGQGMSCLDAAILGVHLHGLAGDLAAQHLGQVSMIATDIIDHLPQAFQQHVHGANRY